MARSSAISKLTPANGGNSMPTLDAGRHTYDGSGERLLDGETHELLRGDDDDPCETPGGFAREVMRDAEAFGFHVFVC